jgi:hypothetical protein
VLLTFFVVLSVQEPEIADVVSKNSSLLASGVGELIGIRLSCPIYLDDVDHIIPSLPDYFAQQWAHILI